VLDRALFSPIDGASLAFFRVAFGAIVSWEMAVYLANDWPVEYYVLPSVHFPFWPFTFVEPFGEWGMRAVFAGTGVAALYYAVGAAQRLAAGLMWLGLTYIFVLDKTYYLNHWYLACLLAFLCMTFPPTPSLAFGRRRSNARTVAAWPLYIIRAQLAIVYVYAGIAKMNGDWIRGIPLRDWLMTVGGLPVLGPLFMLPDTAVVMAWAGLFLDFFGPFGLLWKRTRLLTFALFVLFHFTNSRLFSIGMFPWFALVATTLFFEPSWPRLLIESLRTGRHRALVIAGAAVGGLAAAIIPRSMGLVPILVGATVGACLAFHCATRDESRGTIEVSQASGNTPAESPIGNRWVAMLVVAWVFVQIAIPLRHFLIPGDVAWTEEGHRFSWRMMVRHKDGDLLYRVVDRRTNQEVLVSPKGILTERQVEEASTHPDMIVQLAHWLDAFSQREHGPGVYEIYADTNVSLNGRPKQPLIDRAADLTKVSWPWRPPARWITDAPARTH
jgi:hypothetical protein